MMACNNELIIEFDKFRDCDGNIYSSSQLHEFMLNAVEREDYEQALEYQRRGSCEQISKTL